jgi:glycosyltransferase involved in cell wall biosynthesis
VNIAVHQVLATLGYGDAIGHEVLGIQRVLRAAGYASEIFVQTADHRLEDLTQDYRDLPEASHPDNILIHHFSIGSRASRVAYALPDRMALVYHNITPPQYFLDIHKPLIRLCYLGRRELALYKTRCDLALGDSEFNRQELEAIGFPTTGVLPVVPDFSHLSGPANFMHAGQFDDGWVNVLFVGRMIPNKKIEDVIRIFHAYKTWFNPRSRLLLVGAHSGFERYLSMLYQFIADIDANDVHFLSHVTNEELTAYYELADVFLCASEHEGFCVPLVEAFHMGVPVLAYAATAVPATMDGAGLLYTEKDPLYVSGLIDAIVGNDSVRARVIEGQDAALDRLEAKDFGGTLLRFVDQMTASPRRPHPPVAFDFWDQVKLLEELEEIWLYRPAAYRALPEAPEGHKAHKLVEF